MSNKPQSLAFGNATRKMIKLGFITSLLRRKSFQAEIHPSGNHEALQGGREEMADEEEQEARNSSFVRVRVRLPSFFPLWSKD